MSELMSRSEAVEFFKKNINRRANRMRIERDSMLKKMFACSAVCTTLFFLFLKKFGVVDVYQMWICFGFVLVAVNGFFYNAFAKRFKHEIIKDIFSALIPGSNYQPSGYVIRHDFDASLFNNKSYNMYTGEDFVEGQVGSIKLEFSEIKAIQVTKDSKGRKRQSVVYDGLFFSFSLPKNLNQSVILKHDHTEGFLGRNLGRFIQKQTAYPGYELVQLESVEFEKRFSTYARDQVQARVLLNPGNMDRISSFVKRFRHPIELSFQGNAIYVCMKPGKNMFEPRVFGEIISLHDIREIYDILFFVSNLHTTIDKLSDAA